MRNSGAKGIILEQNKEPALSREIRWLESCHESVQRLSGRAASTPELLAPYEIVMAAREARIIDDSDGRQLWKKLSQAMRASIGGIVVDAIDDEPYISSQLCLAMWHGEELEQGVALAKRSIGAENATIEIYKNLLDIDVRIPSSIGNVRVERVGGRYPAEQRTRRQLLRKNALVVGAGALIALRRAVYERVAHTTCFVTVAGDCVMNQANYEVPIGITVSHLLSAAGLATDPKRIVAGGSMTGFAVTDPDAVYVTPTTRGVLAFADEFQTLEHVCIGCGRCTSVCPVGLSPYALYRVLLSRCKQHLELFDAELCIGCGTCSYICPAKLELAQVISHGANQLKGGCL